MRFEYIEPFVNSTMRVLGGVIRSDVERGEISLTPGGAPAEDLAIAVRLFGDSDGNVVLHMNPATAANICARLTGSEAEAGTPLGMDSLSELANMIAGNAVSALNDEGFDFNLSPPRVVPRGNASGRDAGLEAFRIPLTTDCGEVTIHVTLKTH
jgi:chemotaxis protein CheX